MKEEGVCGRNFCLFFVFCFVLFCFFLFCFFSFQFFSFLPSFWRPCDPQGGFLDRLFSFVRVENPPQPCRGDPTIWLPQKQVSSVNQSNRQSAQSPAPANPIEKSFKGHWESCKAIEESFQCSDCQWKKNSIAQPWDLLADWEVQLVWLISLSLNEIWMWSCVEQIL